MSFRFENALSVLWIVCLLIACAGLCCCIVGVVVGEVLMVGEIVGAPL
jgi:hypothetical protein